MKIITKNIKALLGAASAVSMLFSAVPAHAAPVDNSSPIFSQSQSSQASIADLVNAIKNSANGSVNNENAGTAISDALKSFPGVSVDTVAGAVNQLNLDGDTLASAIDAASKSTGTSQDKIASSMITDTFMKGGKTAANAQIASLRKAVGDDVVNKSLENIPTGMLADAGDLQNIEPAAGGVYEG